MTKTTHTTTDPELLLLAAKAIGATEYSGIDDCRAPGVVLLHGEAIHYEGRGEFGYVWNPLENFDDAFQLQTLLRTPVFWDTETSVIAGQRQCGDLGWRVEVGVDDLGGYQALCRAIVLDAAAIGRAMP
ncbi:hypothetical protein [Tardiphaga sp. 862_B3_N1_1]|uniref:hypothetical protein n=1 Tax=Tardiphaga sp. 862_B3_N1_1 TaxID=3240763 RepID=UPI003F8A4C75